MVPFDSDDNYLPKHPEVLRINPKRQVPVLIDGEVEIFDSTQIFEYLEDRVPEPPLWPRGVAERARARQLEHMSRRGVLPARDQAIGLQHDMQSEAARAACAACARFYEQLELRLAENATTWPAPIRSPTSPSTWRRCSPTARAPA